MSEAKYVTHKKQICKELQTLGCEHIAGTRHDIWRHRSAPDIIFTLSRGMLSNQRQLTAINVSLRKLRKILNTV